MLAVHVYVYFMLLSWFGEKTTVKPVLSGHSKEDQTLVFKIDYRLMQIIKQVSALSRSKV